MVSKAAGSLFGRSFDMSDMHGERLIEMYHHHHEQHTRLVSPRTTAARRRPLGLAKRHISRYLNLTFRHAGVCLRDRKWCNLS